MWLDSSGERFVFVFIDVRKVWALSSMSARLGVLVPVFLPFEQREWICCWSLRFFAIFWGREF